MPGQGYGKVPGERWLPYQALNVVTPGFPEYVSGHSTFSAAGRAVINQFFGTDTFNAKVTIPAGSSKIEKGVPAKPVVLSWRTLDVMADEAGMSRRYGGIHFESGDQQGRTLGALAGYNVWVKAQTYFTGPPDPQRKPHRTVGSGRLEVEPHRVAPTYVLWATARLVDTDKAPTAQITVRIDLRGQPQQHWMLLHRPQVVACIRCPGTL